MYYLRSCATKERAYTTLQYTCNKDSMTDKKLRVTLNRLPVLENPINHKNQFHIRNGKILVTKADAYKFTGRKILIIIMVSLMAVILSVISLLYFREVKTSYGSQLADIGLLRIENLIKNINVENLLRRFENFVHSHNAHNAVHLNTKKTERLHKTKKKSGVCYNDIQDFITIYWFNEIRNKRHLEPRQLSFIEEQCRITREDPRLADNLEYSLDVSDKNFTVELLPDYASYAKGARILTTFNADPYVEHKIQSGVLHYILGIKYFNIDQLSLCRASATLCRYFTSGPSSILQPWQKPGECWAFKGYHGRVQIELSERVYVTSVSLEHIPFGTASPEKSRSAPRIFSIIGIDDSEGSGFHSRNYLGTYEYVLAGPYIQTFSLSKEDSIHPYRIIEFNVESNYGSEYTCVYRLRVHGRVMNQI